MPRRTSTCVDCSATIGATSMRCRACQCRIATKASPKSKPYGDKAMTPAERQAAWRARNPEASRQQVADRRTELTRRIALYKAERGCAKCGFKDPRALDLHHADGADKEFAVSEARRRDSWKAIEAEMKKCVVLCANCHRIEHASDRLERIAAELRGRGDVTAQVNVFFRAS